MPEDGAGRPTTPWHAHPFARRILDMSAHLTGAVLLAAGVASSLAERRHRKNGDGGANGDRQRDNGKEKDAGRQDDNGHNGNRQRAEGRNRDKDQQDNDKDSADRGDRHRDRDGNKNDSADAETKSAKQQKADKNNDDTSADQTTDEPTNTDGGGNKEANGSGNAGSGFFDSSLATKAKRRAKDFEKQGGKDDEPDDGIVADSNPEGDSTFQTGSVSFTTGPDGIEVLTRNIAYTAAPTPTPTPFPKLQFPERERLDVFGDRGVTSTTPTPAPGTTPPEPTSAPPPSDPGDDAPEPEPTTAPPPDDTTGGDNSGDFLS